MNIFCNHTPLCQHSSTNNFDLYSDDITYVVDFNNDILKYKNFNYLQETKDEEFITDFVNKYYAHYNERDNLRLLILTHEDESVIVFGTEEALTISNRMLGYLATTSQPRKTDRGKTKDKTQKQEASSKELEDLNNSNIQQPPHLDTSTLLNPNTNQISNQSNVLPVTEATNNQEEVINNIHSTPTIISNSHLEEVTDISIPVEFSPILQNSYNNSEQYSFIEEQKHFLKLESLETSLSSLNTNSSTPESNLSIHISQISPIKKREATKSPKTPTKFIPLFKSPKKESPIVHKQVQKVSQVNLYKVSPKSKRHLNTMLSGLQQNVFTSTLNCLKDQVQPNNNKLATEPIDIHNNNNNNVSAPINFSLNSSGVELFNRSVRNSSFVLPSSNVLRNYQDAIKEEKLKKQATELIEKDEQINKLNEEIEMLKKSILNQQEETQEKLKEKDEEITRTKKDNEELKKKLELSEKQLEIQTNEYINKESIIRQVKDMLTLQDEKDVVPVLTKVLQKYKKEREINKALDTKCKDSLDNLNKIISKFKEYKEQAEKELEKKQKEIDGQQKEIQTIRMELAVVQRQLEYNRTQYWSTASNTEDSESLCSRPPLSPTSSVSSISAPNSPVVGHAICTSPLKVVSPKKKKAGLLGQKKSGYAASPLRDITNVR
ncbi:hypothetical protein ABK040_004346 [Willaertia magna]